MSRSGAYKELGKSMLAMAGTRFFSSATTRAMANDAVVTNVTKAGTLNPLMGSGVNPIWTRTTSVYWTRKGFSIRNESTVAISEKDNEQEKQTEASAGGQNNKDEKRVVSYWGVTPNKITKEDGTDWKWTCFRVSL